MSKADIRMIQAPCQKRCASTRAGSSAEFAMPLGFLMPKPTIWPQKQITRNA